MKKNVITLLALFAFTIIKAQNVGIGTTTPNASARLDIRATNKGVLIPNVSLTSTTDITTIPTPAISLLVYNTNAAITSGSGVGFYFWDGTLWTKLITTASNTSGWSPTGNTVGNNDFLGTLNAQPLRFKLNGNNAGFIGQHKIYIGEGAGANETSSYATTGASIGIGKGALANLEFGDVDNIAIGDSALHQNIGTGSSTFASRNIAIGSQALKNGTSLYNNIAIGYRNQRESSNNSANISLGNYTMENFQGGSCIAIGDNAFRNDGLSPSSNSKCIAIGNNAMRYAAAGSSTISIGDANLLINEGSRNTSIGNLTMRYNVSGEKNTAYGDSALYANNNGNNNVAMGFEAGKSNTNGNLNCFIGANSGIGNTIGDRI